MKNLLVFIFSLFLLGNLIAQNSPNIEAVQSMEANLAKDDKEQKYIGHWIAAGIGLGITGLGLNEQRKAEDIYKEQYLSQININTGRPFIDSANDKHKKGTNLIYAGAALLLTDAAFYFLRKRKAKKKNAAKKVDKLSFHGSYTPDATIQVGFRYNLGK